MAAHPIPLAALDRKARAQDALVAEWSVKAARRIARGVADARAHAEKALTDTLRRTPDGRATIAKVGRSPSFLAALNRLGELTGDLAGLVKDARESFYRSGFAGWAEILPDDWRARGEPRISAGRLARVRSAALHGATLESDLRAPIDRAAATLRAALAMAGGRGQPERAGADLIGAWAGRAEAAIGGAARVAIRDSMTLADQCSGRDLLPAEWLDDDPTIPR